MDMIFIKMYKKLAILGICGIVVNSDEILSGCGVIYCALYTMHQSDGWNLSTMTGCIEKTGGEIFCWIIHR